MTNETAQHHQAILSLFEEKGPAQVLAYAREHGLSLRSCRECGTSPVHENTCLLCLELLPVIVPLRNARRYDRDR